MYLLHIAAILNLNKKQMTQLLVECKNCGVELRAATQMNEEAFEAISVGNTNESCPNCKRTFAYNKSDYYFK
jgi:hypothetical protein